MIGENALPFSSDSCHFSVCCYSELLCQVWWNYAPTDEYSIRLFVFHILFSSIELKSQKSYMTPLVGIVDLILTGAAEQTT